MGAATTAALSGTRVVVVPRGGSSYPRKEVTGYEVAVVTGFMLVIMVWALWLGRKF